MWNCVKAVASRHPVKISLFCVFALAGLFVLLSPNFQQCIEANNSGHSSDKYDYISPHFVGVAWWCGGIFAKENGEAITALGTLAIAAFTIVLAYSTMRLWRETERLAKGADDQSQKMVQAIMATNAVADRTGEVAAQTACVAVEMSGAAEAMQEVARQTEDLGTVQFESMKRQLRAFVFLEDFDVSKSTLHRGGGMHFFTRLTIRPRWRNSGDTPTRNLIIWVNSKVVPGDLPDDFDYPSVPISLRTVIGPKSTEWSAPIIYKDFPATSAARDTTPCFYIWGRADYNDVFSDVPRFTKFCYRMWVYGEDGDYETQFLAHGLHNRTDHDANLQENQRTHGASL